MKITKNLGYIIMFGLPIIYELSISKALEYSWIEYDVFWLLLELAIGLTIVYILIKKSMNAGFNGIKSAELFLFIFILYYLSSIFGYTPSLLELLKLYFQK